MSEALVNEAAQFSNKMKPKSSKPTISAQSIMVNAADDSDDETLLKSRPNSDISDNGKSNNLGLQCDTLFDPLLSYAVFSLQNCTVENIRKSIIEFFSQEAVIHSKNLLWNSSETSIIGEKMGWVSPNTEGSPC